LVEKEQLASVELEAHEKKVAAAQLVAEEKLDCELSMARQATASLGNELVNLREQREVLQKQLKEAYDEISAATAEADLAKEAAAVKIQSLQAEFQQIRTRSAGEMLLLQKELSEKRLEVEATKMLHHNNGRDASMAHGRFEDQRREIEHLQLQLALAVTGDYADVDETTMREVSAPPTPRAPSPSGSRRPMRGVCSTVPTLPDSNAVLGSHRRRPSVSDRPPAPPRGGITAYGQPATPRGGPSAAKKCHPRDVLMQNPRRSLNASAAKLRQVTPSTAAGSDTEEVY